MPGRSMNYLAGGLSNSFVRESDDKLLNALRIAQDLSFEKPAGLGLAHALHAKSDGLAAVRDGNSYWVDDAFGMRFQFDPWTFNRRVFGVDVVYIMARREGASYSFIYIGKADVLVERMSHHEKWDAAVRHGANTLLVHETRGEELGHDDVESRLLWTYPTPLNKRR